VLLDIKMPELNGIEVLKVIHREYPTVKVLILTAFLDEIYVMECLQYGINGYLTKSMNIHDIVKAIEAAAKNEVYLTNLLNNAYLKNYILQYKKNLQAILPGFTQEEIRIAELLQHERSTEEISQIMHLSKRSIELKREKMKEKARTKTIGGLLLYCLKRGLIE
jgi:DNA-binding NarL/FixJ family response regulator